MNTNAALEQMAKYYWSMLGARTTTTTAAGAATATSLRSWPPPAHGSSAEPSWEELAFARDAAGQLGGCVWPPRSYTCTFCRREFRSAQGLGGHMNVHRRDRARLRQCTSPSPDHGVIQEPIAPPPPAADHHHQLLQLQESSPLFRTKQAVLISGPKSIADHHHHQSYNNNREAEISTTTTTTITTTSPPYISTIIKENKSKVVISIPAATVGSKEATAIIGEEEQEQEEEQEIVVAAGRRKRRRVYQQPEPLSFTTTPFYLRLPASPKGVEHDAKVPKATTNPSLNSLHLADRQEVDLELRLGTSPKVA